MPGLFKLLLVGGALVALPTLPDSNGLDAATNAAVESADFHPTELAPRIAPAAQDPKFRVESRWSFAVLSYTSTAGKTTELQARKLSKLWILKGVDGQVYLEIIHENSDYSFVAIREFHLIRRSTSVTTAEVPIVRTILDDMAFPNFK